MSFKTFLQETAAGGSTGAGSIAANPSGDSRSEHRRSENDWKDTRKKEVSDNEKYAKMREQIAKAKEAKKKQTKKRSFKDFVLRRKVNEDFDMNDIVSRLKGSEVETAADDVGVVSYGVEDDKGNVMRITVRGDQAKEFEETLARQLADAKSNKSSGIEIKGNSLAEILFNLRDKFEIVTVDFPIIPTDVVYNADMASKSPEEFTGDQSTMGSTPDDFGAMDGGGMDDGMGGDPSLGGDASLGGPTNQAQPQGTADDQLGAGADDGTGQDMNAGDIGADDGTGGMGTDGLPPDESTEDGNVEDFGDEEAPQDETSILNQIVSMLKAQANAEEAKADAAAEESRAKQAEWSAIAADKEVRRQEELARVEAQVSAQKKKEKDAKKYADIARYNVQQSRGSQNESKSFLMDAINILKEDQFDNVQQLQKEKLQLQDKYKILPTDDQITQNYKKQKLRYEMDELNARIKSVQLDSQYTQDEANAQKANPQQAQQTQQQQVPQNGNQPATPQNTTPQVPGGNQ
jgi:hypothetical protein